ncbi:MAG TPA: S8 family serine peptidase [Actinomycetota bacterium]|nr:S8 family serine peptidase [Actinomycetota bacterium]
MATCLVAAAAQAATGVRAEAAAGLGPEGGQRALVVFDHEVGRGTLDRLAAAGVTRARVFDSIDTVATFAPAPSAYATISAWSDVVAVEDDTPLRYANNVAKRDTRVTGVRSGEAPLSAPYTGKGVTVAVVDSGVDTSHPDLRDRVLANVDYEHAPVLDPITDGAYSEAAAERPVSTDEFGHGTHVAGIVAGTGAVAQGADMSGVAPEAALVNCKMGFGDALESTELACFEWILEHRDDPRFPGGIRVVTSSWGADATASAGLPLRALVREMTKAGIVMVFAAGNDGPAQKGSSTVLRYPNSMEAVITVGATCKSEEYMPFNCSGPLAVAAFSSQGKEVDVVAPGSDIWSTKSAVSVLGTRNALVQAQGNPVPGATVADQTANRAFYITLGGTSMSTPHVAGIVALMLEANPGLRPAEVESILTETARDLGPRGFDTGYGHGLADALRATRAAESRR